MMMRHAPTLRIALVFALSLGAHLGLAAALHWLWPSGTAIPGSSNSAQFLALNLVPSVSTSATDEAPVELPAEPSDAVPIEELSNVVHDGSEPELSLPDIPEMTQPESLVEALSPLSNSLSDWAVDGAVDGETGAAPIEEVTEMMEADPPAGQPETVKSTSAWPEPEEVVAVPSALETAVESSSEQIVVAEDVLAERLSRALAESLVYPERLRRRNIEDCVMARIEVSAQGDLALLALTEPSRQRDFNRAVESAVHAARRLSVADVSVSLPVSLTVPVCFALRG